MQLWASGERMSSSIVVGWDFDTAGPALAWAARQARLTGAQVVLVHVAVPPIVGAAEVLPLPPTPNDLRAIEDAMRRSADFADVPVAVEAIVAPDASRALIAAAERHNAELLCVGHGRSVLVAWLLGSVANQVIRQSPVPVVVVRG
jgi:nucleotide-binding universal stress UspA family protein